MVLRRAVIALACIACCCPQLPAGEAENPPPMTTEEVVDAIKAVQGGLVRVEYTLRFDKGETPECAGWGERCSGCGRYHSSGGERYVKEERPLETAGFLLSPNQVLTRDTMIHPRFLEKLQVRCGEKAVDAEIESYATGQCAVVLRLKEALEGARPLDFISEPEKPILAVTYARHNGVWKTSLLPMPVKIHLSEGSAGVREAPSFSLVVDRKGRPLAAAMKDELPLDDTWKGSPLAWPVVTAADMQARLARIEEAAASGVLRITINLRSPKKSAGDEYSRYRMNRYGGDEDDSATERNGLGVLMDERTLLVLEQMPPTITARLERIQVHLPEGEPAIAKFKCTLKDYGGFLAELEKPVGSAIPRIKAPLLSLRDQLLIAAQIRVKGPERIAYFQQRRIAGFEVGRWGNLFPELPGEDEHLFLFTLEGELAVLPISMRESVALQERWHRNREPKPMPVAMLAAACGDLARNTDPNNVPLTEEEENRLAWLGVELQGLNRELARANNVAELTKDGEFGAIVSYVYPDSPAAQAGIEPGNILLRLHVQDQPKPLDVNIEEDRFNGRSFPWEQFDQIPEEYFERIPTPWQPAENEFTRALTDFGFGKEFKAELFIAGKPVFKDFTITQSPAHYNMAVRHKSDALGLTVREITYEVRRYFQFAADAPGVIISKVEPGSKASVAGLKPYEIVTQINDEDVKGPADFERLTAGGDELRLNVKRMTKSRVVKIRPGAAKPDKAEEEPGKGEEKEAAPIDGAMEEAAE